MRKQINQAEKLATIVSAEWGQMSTGGQNLSQMAETLDTLMDIVDNVTEYHGGKVTQSAGMNFILVFSDRKDEKDSATSALDAILEMQRKLNGLAQEMRSEHPVRFRAGISSGKILIGTSGPSSAGRMTLLGETVDMAARIRQITNEGQLLADTATYKICKELFTFQPIEPVPVRGLEQPLPLFRLTGKIEKNSITGPGRLIQSAMVGRDREKDVLINILLDLTKGKGGIACVTGTPGTGKSRLLAEVKHEKVMEKLLWFEGRGFSNGQQLSYHPFAGIIKSWSKIREEDHPAVAEKKLKDEISRIYPENLDEVFPFIARLIGLTLSGSAKERINMIEPEVLDKMMLKAIRDLIIRISRRKAIVIAIEDLHWADRSSLKLLRSLFDLADTHPILFMNIMRPGYENTSDLLMRYLEKNHKDKLTTLRVENLPPAEAERLIGNLLQSMQLPVSISQTIITKTGGNPFFIEEVIRNLIDQGVIEMQENGFRIDEKIHQVSIPDTINDVLFARVGSLDEKSRSLLDTASVIGRNFYFNVLDEAADTIGEVSERLQYLKNMQFIQESGDENDLEYVFKHALAHQAAYDSMMDRKRKELHLKIAASIEKVFPERINEFYGTLAMHYTKAESWAQAEQYLVKAGDAALNSAAASEAVEHFKEALRIFLVNTSPHPDHEKLTDLYMKIARSYYAQTLNIEAIDYFDRILRSYGLKVSRPKLPTILTGLQSILILIYSLNFPKLRFRKVPSDAENKILTIYFLRAKALSSLDPKKAVFENIAIFKYATKFDLTRSEFGLAIFPMTSAMFGWSGFSMTLCRKILEFTTNNMGAGVSTAWMEYNMFGNLYQFLTGDWKEDAHFQQMYDYCIERGNIWNLLHYVLFNGFQYLEIGMPAKTEEMLDKLASLGEDYKTSLAIAQYYRLYANYTFRYRKLDDNISMADEGIEYTSKTAHDNILSIIVLTKASSLAMKGDIDKARAVYKEGERLAMPRKILKMWHSAIFTTKAYIELEELKRNPSDIFLRKNIVKTIKKAVKVSAKVMNDLIISHQLSGSVYCFLGNYKKALKHFGIAIELGEKYNGKLELSRTCFGIGKCLISSENKIKTFRGKAAEDYLSQARVLFIELGLDYDLGELEKFQKV